MNRYERLACWCVLLAVLLNAFQARSLHSRVNELTAEAEIHAELEMSTAQRLEVLEDREKLLRDRCNNLWKDQWTLRSDLGMTTPGVAAGGAE